MSLVGGILSGKRIASIVEDGVIAIEPYTGRQVNQASYDLRLGGTIRVYTTAISGLDCARENPSDIIARLAPGQPFQLHPGELYLLHTNEVVRTGPYVGVVDGKSSMGRLGIFCHVTAGYIDPGFEGHVTLEVMVVYPTIVYAGMRFAQIRFHTVMGECEQYGHRGHYVGTQAEGPVPSMSWKQIQEDSAERAEEARRANPS